MISDQEFDRIACEEWDAIPERFAKRMRNIAFIIEDIPDEETFQVEGLDTGRELLGLYRGIPPTERSMDDTGMLPDTITLYREAIREEAETSGLDIRQVIRETVWHEVGHYFGLGENAIMRREDEGSNVYLSE